MSIAERLKPCRIPCVPNIGNSYYFAMNKLVLLPLEVSFILKCDTKNWSKVNPHFQNRIDVDWWKNTNERIWSFISYSRYFDYYIHFGLLGWAFTKILDLRNKSTYYWAACFQFWIEQLNYCYIQSEKNICKEYNLDINIYTVSNVVSKWKANGGILNLNKGHCGRSKHARSKESVTNLDKIVQENQSRGVRKLAAESWVCQVF